MKTIGNAIAGGTYTDHVPDLPRGTITHGHRPWCVDCKRKHDPDQLDDHQRCTQCARAAVTRAAAAQRRAQDTEAQRIWAEAAKGVRRPPPARASRASFDVDDAMRRYAAGEPGTAIAADVGCTPANIYGHASRLGIKAGQDKPTPAAAPEPTTTTTGSLQDDLDHLEATDPDVAAAAASYDDAVDRITQPAYHLQAPPSTAVRDDLDTLIGRLADTRARHLHELAQIELALHQLHQQLPPTPQAAAPVPREQQQRPAAPTRRGATTTHGIPVDEHAIVTEYQAGATAPQIANQHGILPKRVRSIVARHGIALRDDRASRSGGANRFVPTPEVIAEVRHRYIDLEQSTTTIGHALDVDRRVIRRVLVDAGVAIRPPAHQTGGTPLTDQDEADIAQAYADGAALGQLAKQHTVRQDRIRRIVTDHGVPIRPKGASTSNADRLAELGVTANQVKTWAAEQGLVDHVAKGLVAGRLIDAYAAAHSSTQQTGDDAA